MQPKDIYIVKHTSRRDSWLENTPYGKVEVVNGVAKTKSQGAYDLLLSRGFGEPQRAVYHEPRFGTEEAMDLNNREPINVKYTSVLLDADGYGEAARNFVEAMHKKGISIKGNAVRFMAEQVDVGKRGELMGRLIENDIDYNINIVHLTPEHYPRYIEKDKYNIGQVYWETDKCPAGWVDAIKMMDEIWTGDALQKKVFERVTNKPVFIIPECYDLQDFNGLEPFEVHEDSKNKLFLYSIFTWNRRKNPEVLLKTYWKTFEGIDDVFLVLKTYHGGFTEPYKQRIREQIIKWKEELGLSHYAAVQPYLDPMTNDEITRLHISGDVYVSAHSGEGWGIPQMMAMAAGNPLISTDRGGIHEFMPKDTGWYVPFKWTPVEGMPHIKWYDGSMKWGSIDEKKLSAAMMEAYMDKTTLGGIGLKTKGDAAQKFVQKNFSQNTVGQIIRNRLEEVSKSL